MATVAQEFRKHVVSQVMRLQVTAGDRFISDAAVSEVCNWVERKAGLDRSNVTRLIDEAVELEKFPTLADLSRLWQQLFLPSQPEPSGRRGCPACHGRGYIIRTGIGRVSGMQPYAATGAERCQCMPAAPESEDRKSRAAGE
jgi:hypothetical protein